MEDDHGMTSPSNLSSRGAGSQMSPSNSETSESRCMYMIFNSFTNTWTLLSKCHEEPQHENSHLLKMPNS